MLDVSIFTSRLTCSCSTPERCEGLESTQFTRNSSCLPQFCWGKQDIDGKMVSPASQRDTKRFQQMWWDERQINIWHIGLQSSSCTSASNSPKRISGSCYGQVQQASDLSPSLKMSPLWAQVFFFLIIMIKLCEKETIRVYFGTGDKSTVAWGSNCMEWKL